jgi:hypothetical protein
VLLLMCWSGYWCQTGLELWREGARVRGGLLGEEMFKFGDSRLFFIVAEVVSFA